MATYGGSAIFGPVNKIKGIKNPNAAQINQFFGINGQQQLFGGSRGWNIFAQGLFFGVNELDVVAVEGNFLSYADGRARDLVDNQGRTFIQVVYDGTYEPDDNGIMPCILPAYGYGYCQMYKAVFRSLV